MNEFSNLSFLELINLPTKLKLKNQQIHSEIIKIIYKNKKELFFDDFVDFVKLENKKINLLIKTTNEFTKETTNNNNNTNNNTTTNNFINAKQLINKQDQILAILSLPELINVLCLNLNDPFTYKKLPNIKILQEIQLLINKNINQTYFKCLNELTEQTTLSQSVQISNYFVYFVYIIIITITIIIIIITGFYYYYYLILIN